MNLTYTKQARDVIRWTQALGVRLNLYTPECEPRTTQDFWRVLALALAGRAEFNVGHVWSGKLLELQPAAASQWYAVWLKLDNTPTWGLYGTTVLQRELERSGLALTIQTCLQEQEMSIARLWGLLLLHQELLPGELYVPQHEVTVIRDICQFPGYLHWPDFEQQPVRAVTGPLPRVPPGRYRRRLY